MRDRLTELLPLLLAGVLLAAFQLTHNGAPVFQFQSLPLVTPTPTPSGGPKAVVGVAVATRQPTLSASATLTPSPALCSSDQPRFVGGIAALRSALGPSMGEAIDCEHTTDDQGDTQQATTTGLAYYLKQMNTACFTTGWDHWALLPQGLVHWASDDVNPPLNAAVISR